MTNSRAPQGRMEKLSDATVTTGTTLTYTPATALDMTTKYAKIIIQIAGVTAGALALQMKLNANTNYDQDQISADTTTLATAVSVDNTTMTLLGTGQLDGAVNFNGETTIMLNIASSKLMCLHRYSAPHEGQELYSSKDESTDTTITSIEIKVSTSTITANVIIYGILR